jgi:nitrite reductase/ring-hydroxylating ferredoxin subunit
MQFHPLKYMQRLTERIVAMGATIYCHTQVKELRRLPGEVQVITALGYKVTASSVVVATNTPINNTFAIHTKQAPYRTYAMSFRIPKESVEPGLYWDLASPYHYVRTHPYSESEELLIVGGEDHKTGQNSHPEVCFERLSNWASERFSFLDTMEHRWSGQVLETLDGLPFLGNNPGGSKNVYVITGHSGMGVVQSMLGAMLVTDQIMGVPNPFERLYSPSRFSIRDLGGFLKENLNVAAQYSDWLVPQSEEDLADLPLDSGRVVNHGLKKVAVYRDKSGELEYYNAACPHLGGVVHWNTAESSWDCPCHGSRFDCHGKVIEGPAVQDLKPIYDMEETQSVIEPEISLNL